jgi:hypothetical protein
MRVLVCGARDYTDASTLWGALDTIRREAHHDTMVVIQGGAHGADQIAREWCRSRHVPYDNYPADWDKHGKSAGPIRNQRMIDQGKPDLVVAFPGGRGTADMVRRAQAAGVPVKKIAPH